MSKGPGNWAKGHQGFIKTRDGAEAPTDDPTPDNPHGPEQDDLTTPADTADETYTRFQEVISSQEQRIAELERQLLFPQHPLPDFHREWNRPWGPDDPILDDYETLKMESEAAYQREELEERGFRPGANLSGQDLSGVGLTNANLRGADLTNANLTNADLSGVYLEDADLTGADLTGANLTDTKLDGAIFTDTKLDGVQMRGTQVHAQHPLLDNPQSKDLTQVRITTTDLQGKDFSGVKLTGADLSYVDLTGADLSGADLTEGPGHPAADWIRCRANLKHANLTRANLTDAKLSDADLEHANLYGADLKSANLSGAVFSDDTNLEGANVNGANLSGVRVHIRPNCDDQPRHWAAAECEGQTIKNEAAIAIVAVKTIQHRPREAHIDQAAAIIHDQWLLRNSDTATADDNVPFNALPSARQEAYREQALTAHETLSKPHAPPSRLQKPRRQNRWWQRKK